MLDKILKSFILVNILNISILTNANAYIDPGTGSFIIQSILAIGASIVFYLGYPLRVIKNIYNKIFKRKIEIKESKKEK